MKTVLVTCVGSGVGQSVIDSLNLNRAFHIIGCDGNANVYAHSFCDDFFIVPGLYTEGYTSHILELCVKHRVDILIPGHDHELVLFANDYNRFQENNIEVIVSKPDLISVSRDKQDWFNFFAPLGIKIVPTISVNEFRKNVNTSILPAIVKPSGGSASQGISIINKLEDLEGLKGEDIIQPYLFPEESDVNYQKIVNAVMNGNFLQMSEISIQLIFNRDSIFSGIFISKNTLKNGVPIFIDPIDPETFTYTDEILKFVPVLEQYKVKGPVNIQGRVTPKGLYFFEMNMRFTGITGNRALLGFNEVEFLVHNFLNLPATLFGYAKNKVGVRQVACSTITRQGSSLTKETVTILGAGSNVGQLFVQQMHNKFLVLNLIVRPYSFAKYKDLFEKYDNVRLIISDDSNISEKLCQSDVLINFVSALAFEEDSKKFEAIRFIHRLVTLTAKAKVPKIINISSQSVYSQQLDEEKTEDYPVESNNTYAFQKVYLEDLFTMINHFSPQSKVVSLRLPRVIAPSIPGQPGFFSKIIADLINGNNISIEYPENKTNLIHVNDVISSIEFILDKMMEIDLDSVYNVSGNNVKLRDFIKELKIITGKDDKICLGESLDVKTSSMINGNRLSKLGWVRKYSIQDIINDIKAAL